MAVLEIFPFFYCSKLSLFLLVILQYILESEMAVAAVGVLDFASLALDTGGLIAWTMMMRIDRLFIPCFKS